MKELVRNKYLSLQRRFVVSDGEKNLENKFHLVDVVNSGCIYISEKTFNHSVTSNNLFKLDLNYRFFKFRQI